MLLTGSGRGQGAARAIVEHGRVRSQRACPIDTLAENAAALVSGGAAAAGARLGVARVTTRGRYAGAVGSAGGEG
jgi:hypothetical protein